MKILVARTMGFQKCPSALSQTRCVQLKYLDYELKADEKVINI